MDAIPDLTTIAGVALLVGVILEIFKRATGTVSEADKSILPVFATILGIIFAGSWYLAVNWAVFDAQLFFKAIIVGILGGFSGAGGYDFIAKPFRKYPASPETP